MKKEFLLFVVIMIVVFVNTTIGQTIIFEDDFEDGTLDTWTIGGRQQGENLAEVVVFDGDQVAHIKHEDYTEIRLEKTINYNDSLFFCFDMNVAVASDADTNSTFFSVAGVYFEFQDYSGKKLGWVSYTDYTSSLYLLNWDNDSTTINGIATEGMKSYSFSINELLNQVTLSEIPTFVAMRFEAYTTGWPYNMSGDVWVDNVVIRVGNPFETGTVTDIDGNVYQTVKIGDQWWMAENLKVTHYRNGEAIDKILNNTVWSATSEGAYCFYDNNDSNGNIYGALYNWYAVTASQNIAPEGWSIPTDEEWKELEIYLGMSRAQADAEDWRGTDEGNQLKLTSGWSSSGNGTDEYGFSALPGGYRRHDDGIYRNMSYDAAFWSSTEYDSYLARPRVLTYNYSKIRRNNADKKGGFSVRCIKDSETSNLIAYYPFNGNANDESGNGHDGTVNGAILRNDRFGNESSAYCFDGVDDYIDISDDSHLNFGTGNFSITAWTKTNSENSMRIVAKSNHNADDGYQFGISTTAHFYLLDSNPIVRSISEVNDNNWHQIVGVRNGDLLEIYVDGAKETIENGIGGLDVSSSYSTKIGCRDGAEKTYFNGFIDDIRIYNNALTESEIQNLFNKESINDKIGLVAFYPFNEDATDESGNGHDGTVNGATLTTDRFGNENNAYEFDGVNDYLNLGIAEEIIPSNSSVTFSTWIFPTNALGNQHFFSSEHGNNGLVMHIYENTIGVMLSDGADKYVSKNISVLNLNDWNNIVLTYDNIFGVKLYINGCIIDSVSQSQWNFYNSEFNLFIGADAVDENGTPGAFFNGKIDDTQIYNYALSETDIDSLYHLGGWNSEPSDLIAYYPFNGNTTDESGNGHDATVNGAILTTDRFGNENSAYLFDNPTTADTNRIILANGKGFLDGIRLDSYTISMWYQAYENDASSYLLTSGSTDGNYTVVCREDGQIGCNMRTTDSGIINQTMLLQALENEWHHIVCTWDGNLRKMYLDGIMLSDTLFPWNMSTSEVGVSIGSNPYPNPSEPNHVCSFNGKIDDIFIYTKVINDYEVDSLFHIGGWPLPCKITMNTEGFDIFLHQDNPQTDILFSIQNVGSNLIEYYTEVQSPDSAWIVYSEEPDLNTYDGNIWKMRPDGSDKTQLTFDKIDRDAVWSTNGNKIAFWSFRSGNADIWTMDADGSNLIQITKGSEYDRNPSWSPDGNFLLFARDYSIFQYEIETDSITQLTDATNNENRPVYSSCGKYFVCQSQELGVDYNIAVYSINGDLIASLGIPGNYDYQPSWSPDDERVIWSTWLPDGNSDIVSANIDGSDIRVEFQSPRNDWYPRFSPDGSQIIFSRNIYSEGSGDEIYTYNLITQQLAQITDNTVDIIEWSPDWSGFLNQPDWFSVNGQSESINPSETQQISVTLNTNDLPLGDHHGSIMIYNANDGKVLGAVPINIHKTDTYAAEIIDIRDVPEDQGGYVLIEFLRSVYDTDPLSKGTELYTLWRRKPGKNWEGLRSIGACSQHTYKIVGETFRDATHSEIQETEFRITAHMEEGIFESVPMSGYSIDNIAPSVPKNLVAVASDNAYEIVLKWQPIVDSDFGYYKVYRSTDGEFDINSEPVFETIDTFFVDTDIDWQQDYYYRVSAVDYHGNESDYSEIVSTVVLSAESEIVLPTEFALHQNYPNPFNPTTTFKYELPKESKVILSVFDMSGRLVVTIVNQTQEAGFYSVTWYASDYPSGVYLYQIKTGDFLSVKKCVLMK